MQEYRAIHADTRVHRTAHRSKREWLSPHAERGAAEHPKQERGGGAALETRAARREQPRQHERRQRLEAAPRTVSEKDAWSEMLSSV